MPKTGALGPMMSVYFRDPDGNLIEVSELRPHETAAPPAADPHARDLRKDYALKTLDERDVDRDPCKQFGVWMVEAIHAQVPEPTAMTLATVGADGRPSARIVLLKGVDERGFVFYTNYESRKGRELAAQPARRAARSSGWSSSARCASRAASRRSTAAESDAYFDTRPLGSRIGAWASPQSEPIEIARWLEQRWPKLERASTARAPPRPPHWGGYRAACPTPRVLAGAAAAACTTASPTRREAERMEDRAARAVTRRIKATMRKLAEASDCR